MTLELDRTKKLKQTIDSIVGNVNNNEKLSQYVFSIFLFRSEDMKKI